jgi:hypothetical protein
MSGMLRQAARHGLTSEFFLSTVSNPFPISGYTGRFRTVISFLRA